jgi:hypothetical protein
LSWERRVRNLLIIPLIVAVFAAGMYGLFHVMGWPQQLRELGIVALICTLSGELSLIPAIFTLKGGPIAAAQASLVGTVTHIFLTMVLAAVVWAAHPVVLQRQAFIYLLLAFYWISLVGLVIALVRMVRKTSSVIQNAGAKVS